MPTPCWSILAIATALVIGRPTVATSQAGTAPQRGDRVQARIVEPGDARLGHRCEGWVTAVAGDTVVLGQPRTCPAGSYDAELRFGGRDRGSRLAHAGLGFLGGAIAGGILGRIAVGDGCRIEGCDDGALAVGVITVFGTAVGALVGTIAGAALPAGPQWLDETVKRPLRVARLDVHPELRVSFRGPAVDRMTRSR